MRALVPVAMLVALAWPAAGNREFDAVVRSIESNMNVRRTRIPKLGLAKLLLRIGNPSGVKQFDIAIFEDVRLSRDSVRDLDKAVRKATRERWIPMVRVRERGEWTAILARPDGENRMRLLIATVDSSDAVVVHVSVDASKLAATLDEHPRYAKDFTRGMGE